MGLPLVTRLLLFMLLPACVSTSVMQQQVTVCDYDHAWEAALDTVKDRSIDRNDKSAGLIVTDWLVIPMPGRTFGVFQRETESKDRSRITLAVKRLDDGSKIGFIEERQMWAFRGGSRLFGWAPTDPSEAVMHDIQNRLTIKLKEHGCSLP
jgi:hypothetical protein